MTRTILTIGHEQATQAAVVSALREAGVALLADIRGLPLSPSGALPLEGEGWVGVLRRPRRREASPRSPTPRSPPRGGGEDAT